jgi:phosphoglycerate dehydrogenase-like enzyme
MRLAITTQAASQSIMRELSRMPEIEVVLFASASMLPAETDHVDAMVLSDPRGSDGANLAKALSGGQPRTRWVQIVSAGYSGILSHPLPDALVVTNQGGAMAPAVAEHAMALILSHYRRLPSAFASQGTGTWASSTIRKELRSLEGSTVVILGLGHVGQALAARLKNFGVTVLGVTRDNAPHNAVDRTFSTKGMDGALAIADVVVLCLPASAETDRLIDAHRIAAMKPGALIVNVGRGTLIDMEALVEGLASGHLGGAALDVTDPEPLPPSHPLWRTPNVIITPHVAGGGSPLAAERVARVVGENARRFLRGDALINRVHPR